MTTHLEHSEPGPTSDRPPPGLYGTWTIDPAASVVSFAWRRLRLWAITGVADRTPDLVELRIAVDPKQSRRDWLVLRGRGVLACRALATGKWASSLDPTIRLELAVHARRVAIHPGTERREGDSYRRPSLTAEEPAHHGQRAS